MDSPSIDKCRYSPVTSMSSFLAGKEQGENPDTVNRSSEVRETRRMIVSIEGQTSVQRTTVKKTDGDKFSLKGQMTERLLFLTDQLRSIVIERLDLFGLLKASLDIFLGDSLALVNLCLLEFLADVRLSDQLAQLDRGSSPISKTRRGHVPVRLVSPQEGVGCAQSRCHSGVPVGL